MPRVWCALVTRWSCPLCAMMYGLRPERSRPGLVGGAPLAGGALLCPVRGPGQRPESVGPSGPLGKITKYAAKPKKAPSEP